MRSGSRSSNYGLLKAMKQPPWGHGNILLLRTTNFCNLEFVDSRDHTPFIPPTCLSLECPNSWLWQFIHIRKCEFCVFLAAALRRIDLSASSPRFLKDLFTFDCAFVPKPLLILQDSGARFVVHFHCHTLDYKNQSSLYTSCQRHSVLLCSASGQWICICMFDLYTRPFIVPELLPALIEIIKNKQSRIYL